MIQLSPAKRQKIVEEVHRSGFYRSSHDGLKVEIERYPIPNSSKFGVALKLCLDRKWKTFTEETVFEAVEHVNRFLAERPTRKRLREAPSDLLWGGDETGTRV